MELQGVCVSQASRPDQCETCAVRGSLRPWETPSPPGPDGSVSALSVPVILSLVQRRGPLAYSSRHPESKRFSNPAGSCVTPARAGTASPPGLPAPAAAPRASAPAPKRLPPREGGSARPGGIGGNRQVPDQGHILCVRSLGLKWTQRPRCC